MFITASFCKKKMTIQKLILQLQGNKICNYIYIYLKKINNYFTKK